MIQLHDIRYTRLGTPDLDAAIAFATGIVGLQLVAREGKAAYFRSDRAAVRGDTRDHTLVYVEGDPADQAIGLELKDPGDIDTLGAALEAEGRPVHRGTRAECDARRVRDFIASTDPSGNAVEFLARPYNSGTRFFPGRDIGIENFSHIGLFSTDPKRDTEFWTRVLNARVSDWLGEATFLRIHTVHHSVVLMPSTRAGIQHINHQVEDVDDVMRSYYWLRQQGVKIVYGPGRHPISTAMMVYFEGPDGMVFEYSVGVKHIAPEQEATYRPRQFSLDGYNADMWGSFHETEGLPREPAAARRMRLVV
ncbi:MAG: VOC family protein [Rhodospirillales bacterium]|nr:VOC family protein [Rhodospirillales bacterium]